MRGRMKAINPQVSIATTQIRIRIKPNDRAPTPPNTLASAIQSMSITPRA